jgi:hypothetical protein
MKQPFLVCYDYGQGGLWGYIRAGSADEITRRFPELAVVSAPPAWVTQEDEARWRLREEDLDSPSGLLADLLEQRKLDQQE